MLLPLVIEVRTFSVLRLTSSSDSAPIVAIEIRFLLAFCGATASSLNSASMLAANSGFVSFPSVFALVGVVLSFYSLAELNGRNCEQLLHIILPHKRQ